MESRSGAAGPAWPEACAWPVISSQITLAAATTPIATSVPATIRPRLVSRTGVRPALAGVGAVVTGAVAAGRRCGPPMRDCNATICGLTLASSFASAALVMLIGCLLLANDSSIVPLFYRCNVRSNEGTTDVIPQGSDTFDIRRTDV